MALDLDSQTRLHGFRDDARNSDNRPSMHHAKGIDYGSDGSGRRGRIPSTPSLHASPAGYFRENYGADPTFDAGNRHQRESRKKEGSKDKKDKRSRFDGLDIRG